MGQRLAGDRVAGRAITREITRYVRRVRRLKIRSCRAACEYGDEYQNPDRIRRRYAWPDKNPNVHADANPRAELGKKCTVRTHRTENPH
jgi:hypothetical protein